MTRIGTKRTADLTPDEVAAITRIVAEAFEPIGGADAVVANYRAAIPRIALARSKGEIVAFQFYHTLVVERTPVIRFSVAAKSPGFRGRGLHRAMARALLLRMAWKHNPLRPIALVGVCNNPRTYHNALSVGGDGFPDVRDLSKRFRYRRLFRLTGERLGITGLDPDTGLIEGRGQSVGLKLKGDTIVPSDDPLFRGFAEYIGGDPDRGVFTMVVIRPAALALGAALHRVKAFLV